jgi:hypothetical protein
MTSRNKLQREKPNATTSPLAHSEKTFRSIFRKAGKLTLQTSSSQTYQLLDAETIHTTTPLPITL